MQLTFLGTSSMVPTKERNVQGLYLEYNGEGILVDCGEGTQRQMNIAGINRNSVKKVLISHWHGDHVSGLMGLIQTIGNSDNDSVLHLYGPKGTKERMFHLLNSVVFQNRLELKIKELDPKGKVLRFFENSDYALDCIALSHGIPCLGYSFIEKNKLKIQMPKAKKLGLREGPLIGRLQRGETVAFKGKQITPEEVSIVRKGRKISFVLDTEFHDNAVLLSMHADLLIIEATYVSEIADKAELHRHMTAAQAAQVAQTADAKKMIMTHFSQRYKTVKEFEDEARIHFPESHAAFDFMKIKL